MNRERRKYLQELKTLPKISRRLLKSQESKGVLKEERFMNFSKRNDSILKRSFRRLASRINQRLIPIGGKWFK